MNTLNTQVLNTQDFIKTIQGLRLDHKNKWYTWQGVVNEKTVQIKGFGTWLQVFKVEGLHVPTCSDISVKDFKLLLSQNV